MFSEQIHPKLLARTLPSGMMVFVILPEHSQRKNSFPGKEHGASGKNNIWWTRVWKETRVMGLSFFTRYKRRDIQGLHEKKWAFVGLLDHISMNLLLPFCLFFSFILFYIFIYLFYWLDTVVYTLWSFPNKRRHPWSLWSTVEVADTVIHVY